MQPCEIWCNHSEPASLYPEKVLPMHHIDQHCNQIYLFSLRQNTKCNFVTFWTSFYFQPVFVVAEQSMPACFQILRYLTGPLVLGILKKSCNVVQACLGNWQTWYFSAKIRQYWYWYWYVYLYLNVYFNLHFDFSFHLYLNFYLSL